MVRWGYRHMADLRVSTTDPDASPTHHRKSASGLGYHSHYVVAGGKARVVMNVLVTGAEVTENLPMQVMLFRSPSVGACVRVRLPGMRPTAQGRT